MATTDVDYFIDGVNFKTHGVHVSASNGVTSKLAVKNIRLTDWDNYHGYVVNSGFRYKERVIDLECFIQANGYDDFILKTNRFIALFDGSNTHRLKIDVGLKPLVYEVICVDDFNINKKWNNGMMVGTFQIKLVEYEPVKMVLRFTGSAGSSASITLTSSKLLNIYWGDGSHIYDVSGANRTISHTYLNSGTYEIIITGVIEEITNFSTNCTVLWSKLY